MKFLIGVQGCGREVLLGGSWMRIDSIIIEETEKACDSECIWRLVLNSYVYLKKYIKSLIFFKKTLAFLYFMVYTREACDIDSYEA